MVAKNNEGGEKRLAGIILSSSSETKLVQSLVEGEKRFSELQKGLNWTSGRLNYHILRLTAVGLISRKPTGYALTEQGKKIARRYL